MIKIKTWLFALFFFVASATQADPIEIQLDYIGPTQGSVWLGLQQGLSEANLQGEFLGQKYILKPVTLDELAKQKSLTAVLLATDSDTVLKVAQMPQFKHVPVININSDSDNLRSACMQNLLNITASKKMKQDALQQWLVKHPHSKAHIQVWHKDFKKFAASQLNIRFTKAQHVIMDDDAWAGWATVKLLSDTVARINNADSAAMLDYLHNDIAFDAQKGDGATFRNTGQLRQIVLVIDGDKIVAEAPLRGVKGGLDSLGLATCK